MPHCNTRRRRGGYKKTSKRTTRHTKKTSKQTTRKNKSIKRKSIKKGSYPYSQYYRQGHPKITNNNITPLPIKYY